MGKLFERVARIIFYSALLFIVYKLNSFELMIIFGLAALIAATDELCNK